MSNLNQSVLSVFSHLVHSHPYIGVLFSPLFVIHLYIQYRPLPHLSPLFIWVYSPPLSQFSQINCESHISITLRHFSNSRGRPRVNSRGCKKTCSYIITFRRSFLLSIHHYSRCFYTLPITLRCSFGSTVHHFRSFREPYIHNSPLFIWVHSSPLSQFTRVLNPPFSVGHLCHISALSPFTCVHSPLLSPSIYIHTQQLKSVYLAHFTPLRLLLVY